MSIKIGIICEGPIDFALLPALLERISRERAAFTWPLDPDDVAQHFGLRKRGHGGVLKALQALVKALESEHFDHACFVILLDRRTAAVQREVAKLIQGKPRFVLGVAIEEIEAWWLADRTNTLAWNGLIEADLPNDCDYARSNYKAERDPSPKRTLDGLTRLSDRFDRGYGEGNLDMAEEFARDFWREFARLEEIASQCPRGFARFQRKMVNALRRAKASSGRLI